MPPLVAAAATALSGVAWGAAAGQLAIGVGLTLAGRLIQGSQVPDRAKVAAAELPVPDSRPPIRFNYGTCAVAGSPAPWRVNGGDLFGCLILNSRPSVGPFALKIDKRPVTLGAGDPYDFGGEGARVTVPGVLDDVFRFWIGRGDQTSPPDEALDRAPQHFLATDGWRGQTVLWVRCSAGGNRLRLRRWPNNPPLFEVSGQWSKVWDPRDPAQDAEDADTWAWSANQALCLLDALRRNPIRRWRRSQLLLDSFVEAADIADENVERIHPPGFDNRYRTHGQIVWSGGEIEDQVEPLVAAGASRLVHVGGRLGLAPGAWSAPVYTVRETIGPVEYERWRPGRDLPTSAQFSFADPKGDEQMTPLPAFEAPGAQALDGEEKVTTGDLEFVNKPGQAQRVQKIVTLRARAQRRIRAVLPPDAFNVVPGVNVTVDFPAPYASANGVYQVESADPGLFLREDGGVAMRIPVELVENPESTVAWNPATDERPMAEEEFDAEIPELQQPGTIGTTVGPSVAQDTGGDPINRIRFQFDPSASASADGYEWEFRVGGGDWEAGGFLAADTLTSGGKVRGYLAFVKSGETYAIRVRTTAGAQASDWRTVTGVVAGSAT